MELLEQARQGFSGLAAEREIKDHALENLERWLTAAEVAVYRPYLEHLIVNEKWGELLDSFWRVIPFGTGGRRGPVGAGPNRINPYTINLSVQGHCDYLREVLRIEGPICVVVAFDVREFFDLRGRYPGVAGPLAGLTSRSMACGAATTYAANGIVAYVVGPLLDEPDAPLVTDRFISTPELSFLIRELGAAGGLNVSASHNHPDDNGGKFYNRHGGQEIPPDDEVLLQAVERVTQVKAIEYTAAREQQLIRFVPGELHEEYLRVNTALCPTSSRSARVGFTPLCGTGTTTVKEALDRLGFDVVVVEEQTVYDGSFAPVRFRIGNPEVPQSMDRLEQVARANRCDLAFATDPDADRLGMIAPKTDGEFRFINGNEIGVLLLQSILTSARRAGTLPQRPIFINTLVTSSLQREIARRHGCQVIGDLMVGFKYMGDVLGHLERSGHFPPDDGPRDRDSASGTLDDFILTTEESHGYLLTPRVRDKDACGAAVHLAGLASDLKDKGGNFIGLLRDIYRVYGYHRNVLRSLVMEGIVGLERIGRIQDRLRSQPPLEIAGLPVRRFVDNWEVGGPLSSSTDRASRNVLLFELDRDSAAPVRLVVRPSGTEPKTKIYVEVPATEQLGGILDEIDPTALAGFSDERLDAIIAETDEQALVISNQFMRYCLGPEVLGDVYPEIPAEALLVSDLVPVDSKVALCTEVLPELLERLASGGDLAAWLGERLQRFGEDPRGLVGEAANAWLKRAEREGRLSAAERARAGQLFDVGGVSDK